MRKHHCTRWIVVAAAGLFIACGGGSDSDGTTRPPPPPPPPPPPGQGPFAGAYATDVTLAQNSCGAITVQSLPTTVTHNAGTGAITMVHGGTTYSGSVASDSTFTTAPRDVDVGDGYQYRITIAGRFGNRSFVADATVDRSGIGAPCRFVAHWVGSR